MEIHLDKLPLKRVESTDEAGLERFPPEIGTEEKRLDLIRRIDFSWVLEKDAKKAKKKSSKETAAAPPWPWQGLVENLQLARQELSVIIDLINTVEANDAVAVAGMTRPKQLPNELLSDLSVSAATKLQRLRHLGKYFKQSSAALEKHVAREARFYGSLIRLQQNWKIKRQRQTAPGNEGFAIDLHDISLSDSDLAALSRPSPLSTVRVDRDPAGTLALQSPSKPRRSLHFGFHPQRSRVRGERDNDELDALRSAAAAAGEEAVELSVRRAHSVLRGIHRAIFEEQVFDLVCREIVDSPAGIDVTGMREDYLQLGIGQETSVYLCLRSSLSPEPATTATTMMADEREDSSGLPDPICFEIYLRWILHEKLFLRAAGEGVGLLGFFCAAVAHRVFSRRVFLALERLVEKVPYLRLETHPTWHSRTSSWSICARVSSEDRASGRGGFRTRVVVDGESIAVSGEGVPNAADMSAVNSYGCDLADLPGILLQQVATQVIGWLHGEALAAGMKAGVDFLSLGLELPRGEKLRLAAHLDADDARGRCVAWWLAAAEEDDGIESRKYLGGASPQSLHAIVMDMVRLSSGGAAA